ncbi:MAG: actin family [Piptocephalis tieghemiana]|nr:MAG: actin family [Piptocephalis tieghemiana]
MGPLATLALDNGAGSIRAGVIDDTEAQPTTIPNALGRIPSQKSGTFLVGDQVAQCKTYAGMALRRPHDRGILVDWDAERIIWDRLFSPDLLNMTSPRDMRLALTEAPMNLPNVRQATIEVALEERGFAELALAPAAWYAARNDFRSATKGSSSEHQGDTNPEGMVIVDCGFSSTHIIPILHGRMLYNSMKRINVGGKLLTNLLKQTISFRQWNMMDETILVNHVKETCCYLAQDYSMEMDQFKAQGDSLAREYVLPDFVHHHYGYVRDPSKSHDPRQQDSFDQVLRMGNEQIQIPETLFHPNDIGIKEAGLAESIALAIISSPYEIQSLLWSNIILIGGNFNIPGFQERLEKELKVNVPQGVPLGVHLMEKPELSAWQGMRNVVLQQPLALQSITLTKAAWDENGIGAYTRLLPSMGLYT